ncbi:myotrophin [Holotrichia oblita]|uniref:Myotrophin n=2 Tax=Holotrichia oblita TaxID=644536 RepID=A0ACB9SGY3_HOLOL|nr:myotrophin [Holotrichia oblita]KAI4454591.1 myotrophin [Holotrichia oblita]
MSIINSKKVLREIHTTENVAILREFHETHPDIHWTSLKYEKTGDTILHVASSCTIRSIEAVKLLLEHGADVNALKKADWTPLMLACTKIDEVEIDENNYKTVEVLLRNGAAINYGNKDGWTALHLIAREGDVRILELLLEHGLNVDRITKNGRTALHVSALHSQLDMTKKLIEIGLDVNKKDSCGNTPLHESILSENLKIVNVLLENKADLNCRNKSDFSILHLASCQGNINVIEYIIDVLKVDINVCTTSGLTPLHCAARNKQLKAYEHLLSKGANLNVRDKFERLPSDYLCI